MLTLEEKIKEIDKTKVPKHVAVIMDGNGRWAKERNLDRSAGHIEGVNTVRSITDIADVLGVKYITLYTFSTENWNRPQAEIDALMDLIVIAVESELPKMMDNNVRFETIGDISRMSEKARISLEKCINDTRNNSGITMVLALSYSSKWEIIEVVKSIASNVKSGAIDIDDIDEELFNNSLSTNKLPDPDLLIRTGGDTRISNFLLWQIAYSELYFAKEYWPAFTKEAFCDIIMEYQNRERRFGKTSEQITK
ncbi:MAG: isoprenyl transferase [Bacteroidales bacterium]